MQWIDGYAMKKSKSLKSVTQNLRKLSLQEQMEIQSIKPIPTNEQSITSFDKFSLVSTLQRQFKDNHFNQQLKSEGDTSQDIFMEFSILLQTQYTNINIFVTVQINLKLEYIKYISYPIRNYRQFTFNNDQIHSASKYVSLYLNPKILLGCMSVDTDLGGILYQVTNNSLGHIQRRIRKAPNELVTFIDCEIKQIQNIWKTTLPNFLFHMNLQQKKNKQHAFWRTYCEKKQIYQSQDFHLLTQYIKQSYIEYPFMFQQVEERQKIKKIIRIRSRFLNRDEKNMKKKQHDKMMHNKDFFSFKFTADMLNILELMSANNQQAIKKRFEISAEKKEELSKQLTVERLQSKTQIYSELMIKEIKKEQPLIRSGFSQLKLLHILGKKIEDPGLTMNLIVSKETQLSRFINETEILKIIGQGKSLFLPRFYYSKKNENKENEACQNILNDKILLEYCPQKSIDAYLHTHKKFVTLETKIFFLYEIALGLRFLRDYGVIHNDLKPQNVLLKIVSDKNKNNGTFLIRLIDFGESFSKYQKPQNPANKYKRGFTIPYASPEQARTQKFTQKTDVFSYGVMLYEIIFDTFPVQILRKGKQIYITEEQYLKFYAMAPEKCKYYSLPKIMIILYQLCLRCLNPIPINRPYIDWIVLILKEVLTFGEKLYL